MKLISKLLLSVLCFAIPTIDLYAKVSAPPFATAPGDFFSLEGIVDDACSEPFACMIGKFVVEMIEIKNGLKYFRLYGKGTLINSGYLSKNINENPKIIWTVPESSDLINGSVLSLHVCKSHKNEDGSQPIDFYVLCGKGGESSPGFVPKEK